MQYLLLFEGNNSYANTLKYYVYTYTACLGYFKALVMNFILRSYFAISMLEKN